MAATLSHVTIVVSDFAASLRFYDAAFGALGFVRAAEFGDEEESDAEVEAAGWGAVDDPPVLWLVTGPVVTSGAHVALRAPSKREVEEFFAAGIAAGGTARRAPRRWAIFRRGEFNAMLADPDGNVIEVVAGE
jgi:catechol 2,3-dioxygenase-like lactoylglutathione lyase family enzyme